MLQAAIIGGGLMLAGLAGADECASNSVNKAGELAVGRHIKIIDGHVHVGNSLLPGVKTYTKDLMWKELREVNASGAVIMAFPEDIYRRNNTAEERNAANEYVLAVAKGEPDIYPLYTVWTDYIIPTNLDQYAGIKWHRHDNEPKYDYDTPACKAFQAAIKKLNLPVLLEEEFEPTVRFIKDNPELTVIIPHIGESNGGIDKMDVFFDNPKVYFDISGMETKVIRHTYDAVGAKRLIFGTDHSATPKWEKLTLPVSIKRTTDVGLPEAELALIFSSNVERLFGRRAESGSAQPFRGAMQSIDPVRVKVDGEIGRRIALTIEKNLLQLDVENDFLRRFKSANKEARAGDYIGIGKMIDAAVGFAWHTQDPRVIAFKDRVIKDLIASQQADGYIGVFPEPLRIKTLWDLHEMVYIILALANDYRYFDTPASLQAARKLGDYIITRTGNATIGYQEAFFTLYEVTKDPRYLKCFDNSQFRGSQAQGGVVGHAYSGMAFHMSQLYVYRAKEEQDTNYLTGSHRVMESLTQHDGLTIIGTCSLKENFHDTQDLRGDLGESCATAYLMRMAHCLLQIDGKSLYGDMIERAMYNALFAAQSPDGRKLRYFTAAEGPRVYYRLDTYCCPGNWRRIVAELPRMIYYRAEGGVWVNLYTASETEIQVADNLSVRLRQETDYPNSGKVALAVEPSRPAEFAVTLRIPRWCQTAAVSVNGKPIEGPAKAEGWLAIKRSWKKGDVVALDMPMKVRLVRGRKLQAGKVAFMRGPVVFCY
ncbi:MAG: glycoside hydrolase family 127 protein, partial [Kiritimatiellae bacterium]|nr:glycoside hydrolase family 127 protein [Kiritimatiellia bacterium]